jgi:hypothetical protein
MQVSLVICCVVAAINAMPNPQAAKGSIVATAESGHFSYDGKLHLIFLLKYFCDHVKVDI